MTLFVHASHGQHDVSVRVPVALVVNGEVNTHTLGNELLHAEIPDKLDVLFSRYLSRQGGNNTSG